jgi:protein O-GlcNAc transferase
VTAAEYVAVGAEFFEQNALPAALECFQLAADHPDAALPQVGAIANTNLATVLQNLGRDSEALAALDRAVKADKTDTEALIMYGKALVKAGRAAQARTHLEQALATNPKHAAAVYTLGTALQADSKYADALKMYERAAALDEAYAPAQIQIAIVLSLLKECTRAMAKARFITENFPAMDAQAQSALASVFLACDDKQQVLDSYLKSVLKSPGAVVTVGGDRRTNEFRAATVLVELKKPRLALAYLHKAEAARDPDPGRVQGLLGFAYTQLGGRYFADAIHHLESSAQIYGLLSEAGVLSLGGSKSTPGSPAGANASDPSVLANLVRLKYVCADWRDLARHLAALESLITAQVDSGVQSPANPVFVLAYPLPDPLVTRVALSYAAQNRKEHTQGLVDWNWRTTFSLAMWDASKDRVRVGFMTSDLNNNGVGAHLQKWQLWSLCSSSPSVECFVLTTGVSNLEASPLRDVVQAVGRDKVVVLHQLSDKRAVRTIRALKLNIVLDLNGYTEGERPALVNVNGRLAPLQMQFYGYEGTYGSSEAFSHILTDWGSACAEYSGQLPGVGVGKEAGGQGMFAEKLLLLPPAKFPNGNLLTKAEEQPWLTDDSAKLRLRYEFDREVLANALAPSNYSSTFIFCNFAKSFKVQPDVFEAWVRVLKRVPNSVLWLLAYRNDGASSAVPNLRHHAQALGLDPSRLIFTHLLERSRHLQLKGHANLYLDTTPYNGHLTVAESLWAGLPVLTLPRARMASRVSYSDLRALDLHRHLVARTLADYENLAVAIARQWLRELSVSGAPPAPTSDSDQRGGAGSSVTGGGGSSKDASWYADLRHKLRAARFALCVMRTCARHARAGERASGQAGRRHWCEDLEWCVV